MSWRALPLAAFALGTCRPAPPSLADQVVIHRDRYSRSDHSGVRTNSSPIETRRCARSRGSWADS